MTGTVTGFSIGKNRNGFGDVVLLQVRLRDTNDIQTVQLMTPPGDDSIPPNGAKVAILQVSKSFKIAIAQKDNIAPSVGQGEKMIYSQDGGAIQGFIFIGTDGIVELNGANDFLARFNDLKSGFDQLKSDFNAHTHPGVTTGGGSTSTPTTPSTASIDAAKVDEVKVI